VSNPYGHRHTLSVRIEATVNGQIKSSDGPRSSHEPQATQYAVVLHNLPTAAFESLPSRAIFTIAVAS